MKIIFRVDGSKEIGSGHLVRCQTLANELKFRGCDIEFISRETIGEINFSVHKLSSKGKNDNYCPHANWLGAHWKEDAAETIKFAKDADWLVVDHYGIDARWEKLLKPHVKKIMVIDDLADRKHDCDLLLDQNYYENLKTRYDGLVSCQKLLGPKYALLRPEFLKARKNRKQRAKLKNIFICFGGVDRTDETGKATDALKDFKGKITAVVGAGYENYEKLKANKKIKLLRQTNNIAKLMARADLAIGGGGSMTWERAGLGLPTIAWPIAENQMKILEDMNNLGALKLSQPKELVKDLDLDLMRMSKIAAGLCDGSGVKRTADNMLLNLRVTEAKDCRKIFEIRNKKEVRKNSTTSAKISFAEHEKWFGAALKNHNRHILALELESEIIGVLRYDVAGSSAEISVYLDPKHFGNGYGELILEKGEAWLKKRDRKVRTITAKILAKNLKSQKLFTKLGFVNNNWIYKKKI